MLSTVVSQNLNAASVFFLIALILGIIYSVWMLVVQNIPMAIIGAALTFVALGLLFFT